MENLESSQWPTGAILRNGTFGRKTPAGKRFHSRTRIVLLIVAVFWPLCIYLMKTHAAPHLLWRVAGGATPGLALSYLAWETRRYWLSLDELARRLQLESAAWTYLGGIAAGMTLGGISFVFYQDAWIWFWCNPMWVILLEPVRAVVLYKLARRY